MAVTEWLDMDQMEMSMEPTDRMTGTVSLLCFQRIFDETQ